MRQNVPILGGRDIAPKQIYVVRQQPPPDQTWGVCTVCAHFGRQTRFRLPEESAAYERHFHDCSARHMDELRSTETLGGKAPGLFGPGSGDRELEDWFDRDGGRNRQAVLEGRKTV